MSVGVVAACLPTLGILLSKRFRTNIEAGATSIRHLFSSSSRRSSSSTPHLSSDKPSSRKKADELSPRPAGCCWPPQSRDKLCADDHDPHSSNNSFNRNDNFEIYSNTTTASIPANEESEERSIVKMTDLEPIHRGASFTVAREARGQKQKEEV